VCNFYRGYKNHRWVWVLPTQSFIAAINLPWGVCCHALTLLLHLAFSDFSCFLKLMARCSPLSDFAAASAAEVKDPNVVDDLVEMARAVAGELAGTSDGEGPALSVGGADTSVGASNNENSRMYYFGSSTITRGKIKKMVEQGYFAEGEAREPGAETIPKPDDDEAIIYEDFFVTGLRMPPHPILGDILLHF
jgi:hypothetical protein